MLNGLIYLLQLLLPIHQAVHSTLILTQVLIYLLLSHLSFSEDKCTEALTREVITEGLGRSGYIGVARLLGQTREHNRVCALGEQQVGVRFQVVQDHTHALTG